VNDAPALSAAQCGIAVDDATDAAKNAAAIILTSAGLSAIYSAVVESRRIFRKLKAYVTYRFAASIQIVIVLTVLIFVSNCPINPLFIILLALFNDLTMLPIAYDQQLAGSLPENPDVIKMLSVSTAYGCLETVFSLIFAYGIKNVHFFKGTYDIGKCSTKTQAAIWLQMFIACEILIFSARAPSHMFFSLSPSIALTCSVLGGCLLFCLMAGVSSTFGSLAVQDMALIWAYDCIGLLFADQLKVALYNFFNENTMVLPDMVETGSVKKEGEEGTGTEVETLAEPQEDVTRASVSANRLTDWALAHSDRLSSMDPSQRQSMANKSKRMSSANMMSVDANKVARESLSGRISLSHSVAVGKTSDVGNSFIGGSIRPNVPGNRAKF
jgi:hypothetical protein